MGTTYEPTPFKFAVGEAVKIFDTENFSVGTWVYGEVTEMGEATFLIQWNDLQEPTEYEKSDYPDIRHRSPYGEKYELLEDEWDSIKKDFNERLAKLKEKHGLVNSSLTYSHRKQSLGLCFELDELLKLFNKT